MNSIKINLKGIKFKSYWKYENWKLKLKYGKENDSWSMIVVCWIVEKMNTYGMERDGGGKEKGRGGVVLWRRMGGWGKGKMEEKQR